MRAKKTIALVIIIIALICLVVGGYFIWQKYKERTQLANDIDILKKNKETYKADLENIEKLLENYDQIKNEAKKVSSALPSESEIPELLIILEEIAYKQAGVGISQVKINPKAGKEKTELALADSYTSASLVLKIKGTYENFKKFIELVETSLRVIDITSITFETKTEIAGGPAGVFEYTINMKVYYVSD